MTDDSQYTGRRTLPSSTPRASMQDLAELFLQFAGAEHHVLWTLDLLPQPSVPFVSAAFEQVWGRKVQEVYQNAGLWMEALHPDDRQRVESAYDAWLADPYRRSFDLEYRIVRPDGSVRWIHDTGHVAEAGQGPPRRVIGISEDITERRLAQQALLAEQQRVATIAEVSPAVLHSFRRAPDGSVSFPYGTRRIEQIYRLAPGTAALDARAVFEILHPDDAAAVVASIEASARTLQPWRAEFRIRPREGGELWIEGHSSPQADADGGITWHGVVADVTERKRTEQALQEQRARLAAVVAHMADGLIICSADGKLVEWNEASLAMHDMSAAEAEGLTLARAVALFELRELDGTPLPPAQWPMHRVLAGPALRQLELRVRHLRLGWEKVFSYSGTRVVDEQGRTLFGALQCSDVTARRTAEDAVARLNAELEQRVAERTAQLQSAVQELEAFSYSVSHDLRAPLRALDGFSQALLEDHAALLPEDGQRYLGIIRDTAQRMGQLIDDLLEFSRLSRAAPKRRPVDCAALVRHAFDSLAHQRAGREVALTLGELPACEADPALLRQVWINLLSNAIKYSRAREAALIEVGCEMVDGVAEYYVRDNGVGFDMKYAHKLFGVFERLHRADQFEGTGVGLAIVQRIVQRHGGRVRAWGEPGRGASFHFTLG